jgi:hypothetical protein
MAYFAPHRTDLQMAVRGVTVTGFQKRLLRARTHHRLRQDEGTANDPITLGIVRGHFGALPPHRQ